MNNLSQNGRGLYINPTSPIDWMHPLNKSRVLWMYGLSSPSTGGSKWQDLTGYGNNAVLTGGPTWTPTPYGIGLNTNGTSSYATTGLISQINGATKASLGGWIYRSSTSVTPAFGCAAGNTSQSNRFSFIWFSDATLYLNVGNDGGGVRFASVALSGTGWHRVVAVYDGTQSTDATKVKIWVDGIQQTLTFNGTIASVLGTVTPFVVGQDSSNRFGAGSYADVWLANRVWSATEINLDYQLSRLNYPPGGPLRYFQSGFASSPPPPPPPATTGNLFLLGVGW